MYDLVVPKLWSATIDEHRAQVRDAILDTAATLIGEQGLLSLTMSQIAERAEIGRATLYKYFPDVDSILVAWHERQIRTHLEHLTEVRDRAGDASERLEAVLRTYALMANEHDSSPVAALLHRGEHVARAQHHLKDFLRELLIEGARTGDVRDDVAPGELATYCLHALTAASELPSKAAVNRLLDVTLAGLRPPY